MLIFVSSRSLVIRWSRSFSIQKLIFQRPEAIPNVFDRKAKLRQRERTCLDPDYQIYSYVHERVAQNLVDRIFDIKRCVNENHRTDDEVFLSSIVEVLNQRWISAVVEV